VARSTVRKSFLLKNQSVIEAAVRPTMPLSSPFSWRKALFLAVQVALVAALCWALFHNVQLENLLSALRNCPWEFSAGAFLLFLIERLVRPLRLFALLGGAATARDVLGAQSASQMVNLLLPMRAGEMLLVLLLRTVTRLGASYTLSIVVVDRLMDVIVVLLIFALTLALVPGVPSIASGGAMTLAGACAIAILAIAILLASRARVLRLAEQWLVRVAPARSVAWNTRLRRTIEGFAVLQNPRRVAVALAATAVTWMLAISGASLILLGVWPEAPLIAAPLAICFGAIGITLLSVPAGLGVLHASFALAAMIFGARQEVALAFALLTHFLGFCATLLIGITGVPIVRRAKMHLTS
jgi:uncharacterized protein (TIRG00374 family)